MSVAASLSEMSLPPSVGRALRKSLGGLARLDADLPERVAAFLLTGRDEGVLGTLALLEGAASSWLGEPGRLFSRFHDRDGEKNLIVDGVMRARREVYLGLAAEPVFDARLLARLSLLFIIADQGKLLECASNGAGAILQYLANDLVWGTLPQRPNPAEAGFDPFRLLESVAEAEVIAPEILLALVFEREGLPERFHDRYRPLLDSPALRRFLAARPYAVEPALATLSSAAIAQLAAVLAEDALIGHFGEQLVQLALAASPEVRAAASLAVLRIDPALRCRALAEALADGADRSRVVELLRRYPHPLATPLLEAIKQETGDSRELQAALALCRADLAPPLLLERDLALLGGELGENARQVLLTARRELRQSLQKAAEREASDESLGGSRSQKARQLWQNFERSSDGGVDQILAALNGQIAPPLQSWDLETLRGVDEAALFAAPGFGLMPLLRWLDCLSHGPLVGWDAEPLRRWVRLVGADRLDLRLFAIAYRQFGRALDELAAAALRDPAERILLTLPPAAIWPFFFDYPQFLAHALGVEDAPLALAGNTPCPYDPAAALAILALFPQPLRFAAVRARVLEIALLSTQLREPARALLRGDAGLVADLVASLSDRRQEIRSGAAHWLAELDDASAVPTLRDRLKTEKSEIVRAALLATLERFGADLSPWLAPAVLLAEANKGLSGKLPASLSEWFPFEALPALAWQNGEPVEPEIARWWLMLAVKLKEPAGNPLLTRYLSLLDPASRARLGGFVLDAFIAREDGDVSAIADKGVLALVAEAPDAATTLRRFMERHYRRRAQIEALLDAFGRSAEPALLQLLIDVSRRHRTPTIQERARHWVDLAAARQGWSAEQLADRTVPSAGFDERGTQWLDYGGRRVEVWLDGDWQPHLRAPDGTALKVLPAAGKDDDPELVKEAKAQYAATKKALTQTLEAQTARLYDAMCGQRVWPLEEWREWLLDHPLLGRMAQRLVWLHDDGAAIRAFRPSDDGSLVDVEDATVKLEGGSVRLAHAALLDAEALEAWRRHIADYRLRSPFDQFSREMPALSAEITDFDQRLGWISDTFTLRSCFETLGYRRGEARDGGFFHDYRKPFALAGVEAVIGFSGNYLPETRQVAALETLSFRTLGDSRRKLAPAEVPVVVLAEAYGDYLKAASACVGFDPDWQSKLPW